MFKVLLFVAVALFTSPRAVASLALPPSPARALARAAVDPTLYKSVAKLALLKGGYIIDGSVAPIVANRIADACGVLALIKIPAALFAGASLNALFSDSTKADPTLRLSFVVFTALAFALHVCTVFCATVLSWRLVGGGFSPDAESGAALMLRYFPFEYLSVGTFFFGGELSLLLCYCVTELLSNRVCGILINYLL
jgi:hypothetical protein